MKKLLSILMLLVLLASCSDKTVEVEPLLVDSVEIVLKDIITASSGTPEYSINRNPFNFRAYFYADPSYSWGVGEETGLILDDNYEVVPKQTGIKNVNTPLNENYGPGNTIATDLGLDTLPYLVGALYQNYSLAAGNSSTIDNVQVGDTVEFTITPVNWQEGITYYFRARTYWTFSEVITFTKTTKFRAIVPEREAEYFEILTEEISI